MKSGLMYQQYSETNGSSSGQPSPNMNYPSQPNGMDNMSPMTDGAMYRPQGCYPAMYPNMNTYMSGQTAQYGGGGYSPGYAPPPPHNHVYSRHDNMYSPPMNGPIYGNQSDPMNHDTATMQQPGYFRSLMASPLPPSPIHNSGAPTPPPGMRPVAPFAYPNTASLPSNRASPISPMMIRSPASVHSNHSSVPCSSPGPVPSPNLKSPVMRSPKSMMSPPNDNHSSSSQQSKSQTDSVATVAGGNNNPLQSLERLSKLPNKKVVDPKSVVKTENGSTKTSGCSDGRHCSTDSETGSHTGSVEQSEIITQTNESVKQELLSPKHSPRCHGNQPETQSNDSNYEQNDDIDGTTDRASTSADGDTTPNKKKRGRPFGSKTVNRTPKEVLEARKLQKQGLIADDDVRNITKDLRQTLSAVETQKKTDEPTAAVASTSEQKLKRKEKNPIVRLTGFRRNPTSCTIINNTQQNPEEDKNKRRKIVHNYNAQVEDERTIAALAAGTMVTPSAWVCCFCGRGPASKLIGDLFGPYYVENYKQSSPRKQQRSPARETDLEVWVHEECIAWAHGVYIVGGRIQGLGEAAKVASQTVCSGCKMYGATIGCLQKNCNQKYHYFCAEERDCQLMEENFSLFCPKHKDKKKRGLSGDRSLTDT